MTSAARAPRHLTDPTALTRSACAGDAAAWDVLVRRLAPMLHRVARGYGLAQADADDVVQETWCIALDRIQQLRDPDAIAGWLATIARRQSLRALQRRFREVPTDDAGLGDGVGSDDPLQSVLAAERRAVLGRAIGTLPDRHRRLMEVLVAQQGSGYERAGAILDMPVGSLGPIRARSLARLRRHHELRELQDRDSA